EDSYVAELKAVLLAGIPRVALVDNTHLVPAYDVEWGAFQLLRSYYRFPPRSLHMAVVDPGVGSRRKALFVKVGPYDFVGPDNGLLVWAIRDAEKRVGKQAQIFEILPEGEHLPTFHARDLFAPFVVAYLKGKHPKTKALDRIEGKEFPTCHELDGRKIGRIIGPDRFGNIVTSVPIGNDLKAEAHITGRENYLSSVESYAAIEEGKAALVRGSHGFWEIACRERSAWSLLNLHKGDHVTIFPKG
ncbi:MAG: SAM-dependent chlorinase/fluorinase, partial [Deltaproteobacteria bacterium]|nr:SAM-dependent chlorinase/fluorinase [Deltaproteobacteria bacterium]